MTDDGRRRSANFSCQEGHEVFSLHQRGAALAALDRTFTELVITDLYLDKNPRLTDWKSCQKAARSIRPPSSIVITGFGSIETGRRSHEKRRVRLSGKPFKVDEFRLSVQRALSYNAAISETVFLRKQLKKKYHFSQIRRQRSEYARKCSR